MPSNCTFNNIDLIQPTCYNVQPNWIAKKSPPEPWPLPDFTPLVINDFEDYGKLNLPPAYSIVHDQLPPPLGEQRFLYAISFRLIATNCI